MKSLLATVIVVAVLMAGVLAAPESTRAQTPDAGQPPPAASPAPDTAEVPAPTPSAQEDAAPEDPAGDEVIVQDERDDDQRGRPDRGRGLPGLWSRFGRNVAFVLNRKDGDLRVRGRVSLLHVKGDRAEPVNAAFAYSSCTDCQSYAVALEIALISPNASVIAPQNRARAINYECTRCVTFARALQYVYAVDDPDQVPEDVNRLVREMERELRDISHDKRITPAQADARVSAVIAQFQELNAALKDDFAQTEDATSPGATDDPAMVDPAMADPATTHPAPEPSPTAP